MTKEPSTSTKPWADPQRPRPRSWWQWIVRALDVAFPQRLVQRSAAETQILDVPDWQPEARASIHDACREARARGHGSVGVPHLLCALLKSPEITRFFHASRTDESLLRKEAERALVAAPVEWATNPQLNDRLLAVLEFAVERSRAAKTDTVPNGELLLALHEADERCRALLEQAGCARPALVSFLAHGQVTPPSLEDAIPAGARLEVMVHDDAYTPQDVVVAIFVDELMLDPDVAKASMLAVHSAGLATVLVSPRPQALELARLAEARARAEGVPLRFSLRAVGTGPPP